jgi:short-subunit dehydrogenase
MRQLRGATALVTGASGGLGRHIAQRLAREGMNVALVARRAEALEAAAGELRGLGARAEVVPADLSDLAQLDRVVDSAEASLGPIDLLVNNAGAENVAPFTSLSQEELVSMVALNLTAPMLLTHRLIGGMLARGRGHVVFVSSVAGKLGPPFNEPYAATKAGLIGLNQSLRLEYAQAPVGFTVVCPGFIAGDGMYQRMKEQGHASNRLMGETTVQRIVDRLLDAIRRDRPEVVESGAPIRPMLALNQVAPRLVERLAPRFGVTDLFGRVARERERQP